MSKYSNPKKKIKKTFCYTVVDQESKDNNIDCFFLFDNHFEVEQKKFKNFLKFE